MTSTTEILIKSEKMYQQLTKVYPDDTRLLTEYINILTRLNKTKQLRQPVEKLHALLLGSNATEQLNLLEKAHPFLKGNDNKSNPAPATFLSFLDDSMFSRAIMKLKERKLTKGEYLFRAGDQGTAMFLILDGNLSAFSARKNNQKQVLLNMLVEGDIVGELAMLRNNTRSADVIATTSCKLFELSRQHLLEIFSKSEAMETLFNEQAEIRHRITQLSRNTLLSSLPLATRREIAEQSTPHSAKAASNICEAGKLVDDVMLLTRGEAKVVHENARGEHELVNYLLPGNLIGEYALLKNEGYSHDIMAVTEVAWLSIPLKTLQHVTDEFPLIKLQIETFYNGKSR